MMLSAASGAQSAASPTSMPDNQAYIEQLMGADRGLTPQEGALERRLITGLDRGVPRERVVLHLLRSQPASRVRVEASYTALLGRDPGPLELRSGVERIRQFGDNRALTVALVSTGEFFETRGGGTEAGFLDALYGVVLRRSPSPQELASGLGALAGPASRASLARRLMLTPEAQAIQIGSAYRSAGTEAPDGSAEDLRDLARPGGLDRVTARALASDDAFLRIASPSPVRPPASELEAAVSDQPPGYPVGEGFNLNSGVQPLALSSPDIEAQFRTMSAGEDDVLWLSWGEGLSTYDLNTGVLTQVYADPDLNPLASVSAISATEAYTVPIDSPTVVRVSVSGGVGTGTALPPLPSGERPSQVSASADGTLWVLAGSGNVYSYAPASQAWSPISTGGSTLALISVGSASNIWALSTAGEVLVYSSSAGFQPESYFSGTVVDSIRASADGSAWALVDNILFMKPSYGIWMLAPGGAQPKGLNPLVGSQLDFFAAGTMNRAFVLGTTSTTDPLSGLQIDLINFGVVDRPAIPFPSYEGNELLAYQDLSLAATVNFNNDIRSLYGQLGESWSSFLSNLNDAETPPSTFPDPAAWSTVWDELRTELTEVSAVADRLSTIQATNSQIQLINEGQLNAVGQIAGLIVNNTPSNSIIDVILTDLFEGVLGAISSTGISAGFATLAALLAAGVTDAISAFQAQNNVGPDDAVPIEFSQLQTQLDSIYSQSISTINADLGTIAQDRGKLAAVAGKILSNAWPDPDTSDIVARTTFAYDVYFYQALTAAMWQVEHSLYGDYINFPISQILDRVPTYAYAQYPQGYENGMPVEDVYLINQLGSTTDWNSPSIQDGPFPSSTLIAGVEGLGEATAYDFWSGQGDWSVIKRLEATLG